MNSFAITNICNYFCDKAPTTISDELALSEDFKQLDYNTVKFMRHQNSNVIKLFVTIVMFELVYTECIEIMHSSSARNPGEEFSDYKKRLRMKMYLERYLTKIFKPYKAESMF